MPENIESTAAATAKILGEVAVVRAKIRECLHDSERFGTPITTVMAIWHLTQVEKYKAEIVELEARLSECLKSKST